MLFREMMQEGERLSRQMDQLFRSGYNFGGFPRFRSASLPGLSVRTYPLINIRDEGEAYKVEVLAPGVNPDSLNITANRDSLTITGERSAPEGARPEQLNRAERSAGKFSRSFSLPTVVDVNRIEAEYKNGLLQVHVPKAEEARPRSIAVAITN